MREDGSERRRWLERTYEATFGISPPREQRPREAARSSALTRAIATGVPLRRAELEARATGSLTRERLRNLS